VSDTFESEIEQLVALQQIDLQLKGKQDRLDSLAGAVREMEARQSRQREEVARLEGEIAALESQRANFEERIEAESNRIRDSRMRMNRVRNERELLALKHEVNLAQEATKQLEEELLGVMERVEEAKTSLAGSKEALSSMEPPSGENTAARDGETERLKGEISVEQNRRQAVVAGLDEALRRRYEKIFSRRGGMAVVAAKEGTCLGCHMQVPPQLYNELQKCREVRECPNCHRILYWKPEPEA